MLLTYLNTTTVLTEGVKCYTQYFNLSSRYESTYFVNTIKVSQIDFGQWDFTLYFTSVKILPMYVEIIFQ